MVGHYVPVLYNSPPNSNFPDELDEDGKSPISFPKEQHTNLGLASVIMVIMIAFSTPSPYNLLLQPSFASNNKGMTCVTQNCANQLSKCLSNPKCVVSSVVLQETLFIQMTMKAPARFVAWIYMKIYYSMTSRIVP
jgi:hypothetical protein